MSPSTLRRYRAERLLRRGFAGLRDEVLKGVRPRLRARGVHLDEGDLEACYAQAWQGLYAAVAAGEEIANPGGWLAVVTFRRAIDEHRGARARGLDRPLRLDRDAERERAIAPGRGAGGAPAAHDIAAALDDRTQLRQLFEALRSRLSEREREAATLCYLQGLTREQAARRMGISEARMTKLMEGRGAGRPGVAGKVGELLEAVGGGRWCEQQGSLMRGFAFGILDPRGERYRLARLHQRECPACRAYVLSLRGLAAVLPPLPLPWELGFVGAHHGSAPSVQSHAGSAARSAGRAGSRMRAAAGSRAGGKAGAGAKAGAGGALATSGAAGAGGAAGGGWLLGGSLGAKLAVGCLLALGVGCVAITTAPHRRAHPVSPHRRRASPSDYLAVTPSALVGASLAAVAPLDRESSAGAPTPRTPANGASRVSRAATALRVEARHAQREFGLEREGGASTAGAAAAEDSSAQAVSAVAHAASVGRGASVAHEPPGAQTAPAGGGAEPVASHPATVSGAPSHAEREFGPE